MSKKIYINWTFVEAGEIFCQRCGKRETFYLPQSIDDFVKMTDDFDAEHSRCVADVPNPEEKP